MSSPPYIAGFIATITVGVLSDNLKLRGPFVILCTAVGIVGYAILYAAPAHKPGLAYAGTIIAGIGVFPSVPVVIAWTGGNAGGDIKKGVAIAMSIGVANLGGSVDDWSLTMPVLMAISEYVHRSSIGPKTPQSSISDMGL
jgi:predicted MFS family arabinose efflux permease